MNEYNKLEEQWDAMTTCLWEPWEPPRHTQIYITSCEITTSIWHKSFRFCPYCGRKLSVKRRRKMPEAEIPCEKVNPNQHF
jgi:NADH pyrophosphatase NudC (nudix superfamily)